jgi:hypothetical protein
MQTKHSDGGTEEIKTQFISSEARYVRGRGEERNGTDTHQTNKRKRAEMTDRTSTNRIDIRTESMFIEGKETNVAKKGKGERERSIGMNGSEVNQSNQCKKRAHSMR